jgi:hypothetical protein
VLEEDESRRQARLLVAGEGAIELFFGVGAVRGRIGRGLSPPPPHHQDEDVAGVDILVDHRLRAPADGGKGVLPPERDERDIGPAPETLVERIDDAFKRPPLDGEIAGRGDEDFDLVRRRHMEDSLCYRGRLSQLKAIGVCRE